MRFCSKCGKLYDENVGTCSCRKQERKSYKRDSFYDSIRWKKLSNFIKVRDYCMDRLGMYLRRSESIQAENEDAAVYKSLYDYVIDATGNVRYSDKLICHHIVPRNEDYGKQYDMNNLIMVNFFVHEFIHFLYEHGKKEKVQQILRNAVNAHLP